MSSRPSARRSWLLFGLCAAAALVPLWSVRYLPMVDLPQHAAQVSMWRHLNDPAFGFADQVELNAFTPYLLGYSIARMLAMLLPVLAAMKVVVSLAVLGLPLAMRALLRATPLDPDWSLLGFPLAFGFNYHWGFLNYLLAIPIGIAFVAYALRYAEAPSRRGALLLGALGFGLLLGHVLVLGIAGLAAGAVIAARARTLKEAFWRCAPLAVPLFAALAWVLRTREQNAQVRVPLQWKLSALRPLQLFGVWLGHPGDWGAVGCGVLIVLLLAVAGLRPVWRLGRLAPALGALALFLLGPYQAFGTAFVHQRFAVFVLPFSLLALDVRSAEREARVRPLILTLVLGWTALVGFRHWSFDRDARDLDPLIEAMAPNRRVQALTFKLYSPDVPGFPVFLHHAVWYQVAKGGVMGFSFATFFPQLFRYRPGAAPPTTPGLEWHPERFTWSRDGAGWDYFIVRGPDEAGPWLSTRAEEPLVLEGRSGLFSLYGRVRESAR